MQSGALDGKHVPVKKPKKSDAQIFNQSKLKRRIENGTLGLSPPEPLGPEGPDPHNFLLEEGSECC